MSTNMPDNSDAQLTPASTPNQDNGPSAATARHVLRPAIIATSVTYLSVFGITAGIHLSMGQWGTFWITVLIGYAGAVFGWLAGFVASPYDTKEEKRLTRVTSFISLITSGYLIGKLEPSISLIFSNGNLINEWLYGVRLLNFLINLICTGITVYLYRLYGGDSPYDEGSPSGETRSD